MKTFGKYWSIFQITLINSLAYPGELIGRSLMIIPFMWIFYQLWKITFNAAGSDVISGLTLRDMLWYLMLTETIELGRPPLARTMSENVKDGSIAYILNKPYDFLLYHGYFSWDGLARFVLAMLLAATVFAAFLILVQSLAFWLGMMSNFANLALNAMLTFGIYPITLFDNYAKLILFTIIPAALMGAVPAEFIRAFTWRTLGELFLGAAGFLTLAILIFNAGLRRYESGSAIQIEV